MTTKNTKPTTVPTKPKKKEVPPDQPTRKSIADLIRRLDRSNYRYGGNTELNQVQNRIEARQREILAADLELKELKERAEGLRRAQSARYEKREKMIGAVRAMFEAQGVTPTVVKKVNALVAEFFPETVSDDPAQNGA